MSDADEQLEVRSRSARSSWIARAPIIAFVVAEIIAFVFWLDVGRSAWFYNDEWDFLSKRKVGDLGDLMRPHNGHWTTIPIVAYRVLFALFGLRSYLPYRLLVLVLYLAAAALLLIVMRRAGAQPWIATSAAALFALFGAGWVNILRPFQVTFTGALTFGLLQLILSDHDGRFDQRDGLAMVSGLVALMMSGVGVVMVMVVGIAVLLRRGWRPALVHVAPLAAIYLLWLVAIGHQGGVVQSVTASEVVNFVATGLRAGFRQMGASYWFGAPLLAVILIGGFVLATRQRPRADLAQLAGPFALLCGAVLLLGAAALQGRTVTGSSYARQSRYLSLVVAMSLPALAVATDAFTRIWRWLLPFAMALFLVAIPHNIRAGRQSEYARAAVRGDQADGRSRAANAEGPANPSAVATRPVLGARPHRRVAPRRARRRQVAERGQDQGERAGCRELPAVALAGRLATPGEGRLPRTAAAGRRAVPAR